MELDEAERSRIRLEERYRDEVRSELEAARKERSSGGARAFLNSNFGLWLLSAIFISGAGTLYQQWQKSRDEEKAVLQKARDEEKAVFDKKIAAEGDNRESISRLDVEISYRLSTVLLTLASIPSRIDVKYAEKSDEEKHLLHAELTFGALQGLGSREQVSRSSLYPEYSSYTFPTLLAELRRRLPEAERERVESSIAAYAALQSKLSFSKDGLPSQQAGAVLFQKVILPRWQGTAFHHIDCNEKNPFC